VLSVFTSAPVKYETRDFLLHLFSNVCSRVIEKQKGLRSQAPWLELAELRDEAAGVQMNRLRHVASLATLLGIVLWVLGGLLAIITATAASPPQQLTKQPSAVQNKGAPASSSDDDDQALLWIERVLREYVLETMNPQVIVDWVGRSDSAQHGYGVGSPEALFCYKMRQLRNSARP
jgi:hypothetical protein